MASEHRKKLSLGDIIRKLNEGGKPAQPLDTSGKSGPLPLQQPATIPQPGPGMPTPSDLPPQPAFGTHAPQQPLKNVGSRPIASINPQTALHIPATPKAAEPPAEKGQQAKFPPASFPLDTATDASQQMKDDDEEEFDIFKYVTILFRRRSAIISVVILALLYSLVTYLRSEKFYTAHARLLFRPPQQLVDVTQGWRYWTERQFSLNTHLELLKSNNVLERVADKIGSAVSVASLAGGLTIAQGKSGEEENDIIELSFKHTNAEVARDAVNEVCHTYIDYRREVNAQENTRFIFQLETQIDKLQTELDKKENDLRVFKENNRLAQLSSETNIVVTKLSNMELALQQTNLDLLDSKKRLEALKAQIGQQEINVVQSMTYDNAYQNRLGTLELQLSSALAEYSPEHYKVKMLKQEIDKLKEDMKNDIESKTARQTTMVTNPIRQSLRQEFVHLTIECTALETKQNAQEKFIEQLNGELLKLPSLEQRYAYLQRETESSLQTLRLLKSRLEEAKILRDSQESDLKVLEIAKTPTAAVSAVKLRTVLIGILVGLILGIALAFLLEYLDQSIKDPADVEKLLEIPLLGVVPLIEAEQSLVEASNDVMKSVIEPFRALRATLNHLIAQHGIKTLMVSSAVKGEGKTTLVANLAITFALEKKVILVDGDLRRPQIHKLFGLPKENGVAEYLQATVDDVSVLLKSTRHENLKVVTCGVTTKNPAELVGTLRFVEMVKELRRHADIVLLDSPALLPVSDVITMAPKIDAVMMVTRTMWTPSKAAQKAKEQLQRIGCKILGGILNGVSHSRGYYPYYYGYYGYYSYKYDYGYEHEPKGKLSLREAGNKIEAGTRDFLQNAHVYLPHYIALGLSFIRYSARKPLFWILLVLLVGLTLFEAAMRPKENPNQIEGIQYMQNGAPATGQVSPANQPSKLASASFDELASHTPILSSMQTPDSNQLLKTFSDSLKQWATGFNSGNLERYLSFYDTIQFNFPDGGFMEWRAQSEKALLSARNKNGILRIDILFDTIAIPMCRISAFGVLMSLKDTLRIQYAMIWRQHNNMWRIIKQKNRE